IRAAADEEGLDRRSAGERALLEQLVEERGHRLAQPPPRGLVVRLEVDPLDPVLDALLDVERRAPDRHVLPVLALAAAAGGSGAPDDEPVVRDLADDVHTLTPKRRGRLVVDRGGEADGA